MANTRRVNYNQNLDSATAVTKDVFSQEAVIISGAAVYLGDGELVLVTKEGEEGIYGYNHYDKKPVQFNSTEVIKMSPSFEGGIVKSGDTLNEAFKKVENAIGSASGTSSGIAADVEAIKESVGLDADGKHIPSSGYYTSAATTVEGEIAALDKAVKTSKLSSSDNTLEITEGTDGTDAKVNLDNTTLVNKSGVIASALALKQVNPVASGYSASYALGTVNPTTKEWTILPNSDYINLAKDLVVTKGEIITVDDEHPVEGLTKGTYIKLTIAGQEQPLYINCKTLLDDSLDRTVFSGNAATYSEVETGKTYDSTGAVIKTVTVKNILKKVETATVDDDGLASAYDVKSYLDKKVDGDSIYVGTKAIPSVDGGRLDDNALDEGYDTVHVALKKFDFDFARVAETLGVDDDGLELLRYPADEVKDKNYISGSTNVMEAIYDLASGLTEEKANLRDDLNTLSANTVQAITELSAATVSGLTETAVHSDKTTILVSTPSMTGTNIDVNIHEATTDAVSKTDPEVVATDKNFLEQATSGDKGLKVTGMDSDVTVTTAPIKILGWHDTNDWVASGVYANWNGTDVTTGDTGINTIPAGTSIQEILENLLSRVLYPNAATKPTISVTLGASLSGYKEVGSTVSVPSASISTTTGKFNASYTNVSQPTPSIYWTNTSITTSKTGFTDYTISTSSSIAAANATVSLGTNKVNYAGTDTYSVPTNSPVRNDNEATTKTGKTAADGTATWVSTATTASTSVTVTGVYATYTNGVAGQIRNLANPVTGNGTKLAVTSTYVGGTFYVGFAAQLSSAGVSQPYTMFVPNVYAIDSAYAYNGLTGKYDKDAKSLFVKNGTTTRTDAAGNSYTCDIYQWSGTAGSNDVQFKLKSA